MIFLAIGVANFGLSFALPKLLANAPRPVSGTPPSLLAILLIRLALVESVAVIGLVTIVTTGDTQTAKALFGLSVAAVLWSFPRAVDREPQNS